MNDSGSAVDSNFFLPVPLLALAGRRGHRRRLLEMVCDLLPENILARSCYVHTGTTEVSTDQKGKGERQKLLTHLVLPENASFTHLESTILLLARGYDLVLLDCTDEFYDECRNRWPESCVCVGDDEVTVRNNGTSWHGSFPDILNFFDEHARKIPTWACILIGGKSSRMGQPKHLIRTDTGQTWLEKIVETVRSHVAGLVVAGGGSLPDSVSNIVQLQDYPHMEGPCAGIFAAFRYNPAVAWLVVACDMPEIESSAVAWLLGQRRFGRPAVLPRLQGSRYPEPLFAWYGSSCAAHLEVMHARNIRRIGEIAAQAAVCQPVVPPHLASCWTNVNRPEQIGSPRR